MFRNVLAWLTNRTLAIRQLFWRAPGGRLPSGTPYLLEVFEERSDAVRAAKRERLVAIAGAGEKFKWAFLRCPCGCGEQIALNLMPSHHPSWQVRRGAHGDFSVAPSVFATSCGAHFWLEDGRIRWCD